MGRSRLYFMQEKLLTFISHKKQLITQIVCSHPVETDGVISICSVCLGC